MATFLLPLTGVAQILTGTIAGTVEDSSHAPVPAATVALTQPATGLQQRLETNASGEFVFNALETGVYQIVITKTGFKRAEKRDLVLDAGGRLPAGTIVLELGSVSEVPLRSCGPGLVG